MAFSTIFSHFRQFLAKMADFDGVPEVETVQCFNLPLECLSSGQKEELNMIKCPAVLKLLIVGPKIKPNGEKSVKTEIIARQTLKDG